MANLPGIKRGALIAIASYLIITVISYLTSRNLPAATGFAIASIIAISTGALIGNFTNNPFIIGAISIAITTAASIIIIATLQGKSNQLAVVNFAEPVAIAAVLGIAIGGAIGTFAIK